ncbi:MAG: condensation domain-containing protein [Vicinamibacterales bacterium]|nr:condensation domain-containing protein [Vicinamibacterales bacterium]
MTASASAPASWIQRRFLDAPWPILVQTTWQVGTRVDEAAAGAAVARLAARHPMLRTVFIRDGEAWRQEVQPQADPAAHVQVFAAEGWTPDALHEHLRDATATAFDLSAAPPWALRVYRRGEGTIVMLVLHHALADGWGLATAATELWECYAAVRTGREPRLPGIDKDYHAYVALEAGYVASAGAVEALARVQARLADAPRLAVPMDRPRREPPARTNALCSPRVGAASWARTRAQAAALRTTPFVLSLAAYFAALAAWTGERDLVVGTSTAGRWSASFRHVVAPFVNPVAVRTEVDPGEPWSALVARVQRALHEAVRDRDLPFGRLVEARGPGAPLPFETMIIMLNVFDQDAFRAHLAACTGVSLDATAMVRPIPNRRSRYDAEMLLYEYEQELNGVLDFDAGLFDSPTIERLSDAFVAALDAVTRDPAAAVAAGIPLMEDQARARV